MVILLVCYGSPMPRRRLTREESKARTRSELLRAANRLFPRDGFVDTSLTPFGLESPIINTGAVPRP